MRRRVETDLESFHGRVVFEKTTVDVRVERHGPREHLWVNIYGYDGSIVGVSERYFEKPGPALRAGLNHAVSHLAKKHESGS